MVTPLPDAGQERYRLLSEIAAHLLLTDNSRDFVRFVFDRLGTHLGVDSCFNYLAIEGQQAMRLDFSAGIPPEVAATIETLPFGSAVCGCVAVERRRIVVEDITASADPRVELVRGFGIQAYACHPLLARGHFLGTLSFGSRTRAWFTPDELDLMQAVSAQVAAAMERLQLIDALRGRAEALADSDRRKDEFLAMLAHELRNPLAPALTSVHILRYRPGDADALDIAERQLRHMARLVDDLLDISRVTQGKIRLVKEAVDVHAAVNRVVRVARPHFDSRGHELTVSLPPAPLNLSADAMRLEQILVNLLQNAAKYTPDGGRVWLTVGEEDGRVVFRVRDSGVGLRPEMLTTVFDIFVQSERGLDRAEGGLGLGLTLVKTLAELHGGTVEARSDGPGRGSEFIVRLPAPAARARNTRPAGANGGPGRALRVLVVDDNTDAADSLALMLNLWGHEVRTASDGEMALKTADNFLPEVVFLDIGLPGGMSGYDVARRLRRMPDLSGCVIAAVTGYGQSQDRQRSRDAGIDRHLVKPADAEHLHRLLAEVGGVEVAASGTNPRLD